MKFRTGLASFVPPLLPDQTLYSWTSMFHVLSGHATAAETRNLLFGSSAGGQHFHIPSSLDDFCASTQFVLGRPEDLVASASILPYYTRFRVAAVEANVLQRARGKQTVGVSQALGIMKSAAHVYPPRRHCRICVQVDQVEYGFAYWHRLHQLPGVLVCPLHDNSLGSRPLDRPSMRRPTFLWPTDDLERCDQRAHESWSREVFGGLKRLATLAAQVISQPLPGGYSKRQMRLACLGMLRSRGLLDLHGELNMSKSMEQYRRHFAQLASVPEIASVSTQRGIHVLGAALSQLDSRANPLEFVLVIDWLFGDWATFRATYSAPSR